MTRLTFHGGKELERALKDLGGSIAGRLGGNAARAGARVLVNEAKLRVPVKTGALKKSIRVFSERSDRGGTLRQAWAGTRMPYAHIVEHGSRFVSAQPYMRPAIDEGGQAAVNKAIENLSNGIERELSKRPVPADLIPVNGE